MGDDIAKSKMWFKVMVIHTHNFESFFPDTVTFQTFHATLVKGKKEAKMASKSQLKVKGGGFSQILYYLIEEVYYISSEKVKALKEEETGYLYIENWEKIKNKARNLMEEEKCKSLSL